MKLVIKRQPSEKKVKTIPIIDKQYIHRYDSKCIPTFSKMCRLGVNA